MKVFFISTEKSCNKCLLLVLQIYLICVVNIAQIQFDLQENKAQGQGESPIMYFHFKDHYTEKGPSLSLTVSEVHQFLGLVENSEADFIFLYHNAVIVIPSFYWNNTSIRFEVQKMRKLIDEFKYHLNFQKQNYNYFYNVQINNQEHYLDVPPPHAAALVVNNRLTFKMFQGNFLRAEASQ